MNKYLQKLKSGNLIETIIDYILGTVKYSGDSTIMERYRLVISHKRKLQYYKKIKKTVLPKAFERVGQMNLQQEPGEKIVWFCWFQGMENAPEVVKRCYESQKKYLCKNGEWKIIVVTEDNYSDYVQLPAHIVDKVKKGIITKTHLSDILRTALLCEHGGLWIDSTVLCTGDSLWNYIKDMDLFLLSNWRYHNTNIIRNESFFIRAKMNHPILVLLREILYEYWKQYDYLMHYFTWHICFTIASELYPSEINGVPQVNKVLADQIGFILFEKYNETRWKIEKMQSDIHKLSWKYDADLVLQEGTLYDYLVRRGRE